MKVNDPRAQIEEGIKNVLRDELEVSPAVLAASSFSTPLLGHGIGLDSVETLTLVLAIEEKFGIHVPDSDLTAALFNNIGTLTEYVLEKIAASKGVAETPWAS
jgi:acyl carrier protein